MAVKSKPPNGERVNHFGERIRERRMALGMSLRELGKQVELTASFLAQVERGQANPSVISLQQIARALKAPIFYFFTKEHLRLPAVQVWRARPWRRKSMSESVFLPKRGLTMIEATIVNWLKKEGDLVAADEELVEVETDKVVNTLTAPIAGVLTQILVKEQETVEVGTELAVITPAG